MKDRQWQPENFGNKISNVFEHITKCSNTHRFKVASRIKANAT